MEPACSLRRVTRLLLWLGSTRAKTLRRATALACSVGASRVNSLPVRLHSPEMLAGLSSSAFICTSWPAFPKQHLASHPPLLQLTDRD